MRPTCTRPCVCAIKTCSFILLAKIFIYLRLFNLYIECFLFQVSLSSYIKLFSCRFCFIAVVPKVCIVSHLEVRRVFH